MKKIISLLVLVFAMTVVMSVSAFAAAEFALAETAVLPEGVTVTPAADSIAVSVPATDGADYSILLVSGNALPTSDSVIAYINQAQADGTAVAFDVLPLMSVAENAADGELTLYVGTNATGEDLISIPVTYTEVVVEPEYILGCVTLGDSDVDISDVLLVLDAYLGTATLTDVQELAADVAPRGEVDGNVDISDVLLILDYYLGTVPSLN